MTVSQQMPKVIVTAGNLMLKSNVTVQPVSSTTAFFDILDLDHTAQNYASTTLTAVADTSKQTIANISGAGLLTHIIASALSAAGTMTITVTIDGGDPIVFFSGTMASVDPRLCVGDIRPHFATSGGPAASVGGRIDQGYGLLGKGFMTKPTQTVIDTNIGMVFQTSCLVEQEPSVNLETLHKGKASISYLTYIPHGLI